MVKEESFEKSLARLEEIVGMLEEGDIPLEESVNLYKEGISLSKSLKKRLEKTENELLKLSKNTKDGFQLEIIN